MKTEDRHSEQQGVAAGDSLAAEARLHLEPILEAAALPERMDAFVDLVRWTRSGWGDPALHLGPHLWPRHGAGRLEAVVGLLESDGDLRRRYLEAIATVFHDSDATNAFGHAGIPSERGFLAELGERIMDRLLPRPRNDRDLATLLRRLFRFTADVERFEQIPEPLFERMVQLHALPGFPEATANLRRGFADGFRLLATWTQAQGLSPKLRKRGRPKHRDARAANGAELWCISSCFVLSSVGDHHGTYMGAVGGNPDDDPRPVLHHALSLSLSLSQCRHHGWGRDRRLRDFQ